MVTPRTRINRLKIHADITFYVLRVENNSLNVWPIKISIHGLNIGNAHDIITNRKSNDFMHEIETLSMALKGNILPFQIHSNDIAIFFFVG